MHSLTNNFLRSVSQNMPDVPDNVMQWWTAHNGELQKVLQPLLKIPPPTVVGTYAPKLGSLFGPVVDHQGNCWVAARLAFKVLKITPDGVISTMIDFGPEHFPGAVDVAPDGTVWVGVQAIPAEVVRLDPNNGSVMARIKVSGSINGAISVLKVDQATGDVWACDSINNCIYRISQNTNLQTYAADKLPNQMAIAKDGTVWVVNWNGHTLTKITPANKASGQSEVVTLLGTGYATYLAVDALGNVCCSQPNGVTRIDTTGHKEFYPFPGPYGAGLAADTANNFWVAAGASGTACKIDQHGNLGSPIAIGNVQEAQVIADGDGYVWVAFWDGAGKRGLGRITPAGVFEGPFLSGLCRWVAFGDNRIWVVNEEVETANTVVQLTR